MLSPLSGVQRHLDPPTRAVKYKFNWIDLNYKALVFVKDVFAFIHQFPY